MKTLPNMLAYYYTGWVSNRPFDEWQVVAQGKSAFSGHRQPRKPIHTYDVLEPGVLESHIEAALSVNIKGFVFCWYWDNGKIHLAHALNRFKDIVHCYPNFQFAIIWVNRLPHQRLPLSVTEVSSDFYEAFSERIVKTSESDLKTMNDFCYQELFSHPNYIHIDGKPLFLIFSIRDLFASLGSSSKIPSNYLKNCLEKPLYLTGIAHGLEDWLEDAKRIGFNALTSYVLLPDWHGPSLQDYRRYANKATIQWDDIQKISGLPYFPAITVGWDASCRGKEPANVGRPTYPWVPIVVNDSPNTFREHLLKGLVNGYKNKCPYIFISSWNEWSEGHYLESDSEWGTSYLDAVKEAWCIAEKQIK